MIAIFAKHNNYIIGLEDGNENMSIENDINDMIDAINKVYDTEKMNFNDVIQLINLEYE